MKPVAQWSGWHWSGVAGATAVIGLVAGTFALADTLMARPWWPVSQREFSARVQVAEAAVQQLQIQVLEGQIEDRYGDYRAAVRDGEIAYQRRLRKVIRSLELERNRADCEAWLETHPTACPPPPASVLDQ